MSIKNKTKLSLQLIIISLLLSFMFFMSSCTNRQQKTWEIAMLVKTSESDFFQTVKNGADAASKEYNANIVFRGPERESEVDEQINMLYQLIERKPDVILLAASDYDRLVEPASAAIAAGIPVITIDSGINLDSVSSVIETDNFVVGSKIGQAMANSLEGNATVLLVNFVAGTSTADAREAGFIDAVSQYDNIEIADIVYCNSQEQIARQQVLDGIEMRSDINVVVGLNAHSTIGAVRAILDLREMGEQEDIKVFGVDSTPEEVLYLDRGELEATVIQNPYAMGYFGVQEAVRLLQGESIEQVIYTDSVLIDRNNMYAPENQKLVFPLVE